MRIIDWSSDVCSSDLAAAAPDDAREFVAERGQLSNLRLDLLQMRGRDAVGLAAVARRIVRQVEQRADFLDRETQRARMAHEAETRPVRARIAALVGGGTIGRRENAEAHIIGCGIRSEESS